MIGFTNVYKSYEGKAASIALEDINLEIHPGEFVSVVGRSGAGKSTLLKLLIGEERPSKGRILVGSYEVNKMRSKELPSLRRQIGMVFQDFRLLPRKTAFENVAFALEVEGRSQAEIDELVPQVLDMVGLSDKQLSFPHELSGGERQRVAIARALIHHPKVMIADEPTGNLDEKNTEDIIKLIAKINELGTTVLLATHNRHVVNLLKKRVVELAHGKIVRDEKQGKYGTV
ncbi:MAG: cell division ATP-binding protein FtsE [Patescibacteria group bacterium]